MTVTMRRARATDAEDIVQLTKQLGYDLIMSDAVERIRRIVSRDSEQFLIAEVDGRAAGWVHAALVEYVESEPFVMIGGLVVDKAHRRQGIGRLMMERVEEWAKQRECLAIRLSSSSTRTVAHAFYERMGYENIKTQYAFAKLLDAAPEGTIRRFVPRVDG
jgi:GNAT superfamily N-acetyltransferase